MSVQAVIAVLLRVLAIFLAWRTVTMLPDLLTANSPAATLWIASAALLSGIAAAGLLWWFNADLAKLLMRGIREQPQFSMSGEQFEVALFAMVGLWIFVRGIMDSMWWLSFAIFIKDQGLDVVLTAEQQADVVVTILELILGALIALKARGLRGLLQRLRERA